MSNRETKNSNGLKKVFLFHVKNARGGQYQWGTRVAGLLDHTQLSFPRLVLGLLWLFGEGSSLDDQSEGKGKGKKNGRHSMLVS